MDLAELKATALGSVVDTFDVTQLDIQGHDDLVSYAETCPKYTTGNALMFFPDGVLSTLRERGYRHMLAWASRHMAGAVVEISGNDEDASDLEFLLKQYWPDVKCYSDSGQILGIAGVPAR